MIFAAFLVFLSVGCASAPDDAPGIENANESYDTFMFESVSTLQGDTFGGLDALFRAAEECALYAKAEDSFEYDPEEITGKENSSGLLLKMFEIVSENDCILTVAYIGNDCILKDVYPKSKGFSGGELLSGQESVVYMNQNKVPLLTNIFELNQGGYGAAVYYPVFSGDSYEGFISIAFKPEIFFGRYAKKLKENSGLEIMVLQKDGLILYDPDETETGKPTFNNPEYENFPEILEAAEKIVSEWSGNTGYSYYSTGTNSVVKKRLFWTTVSCSGNEWKVTVIRDIS